MRQSILCMSVSAVILGSGLSGCASLQTKWFGVKSSGVTLPSDMSKAAYLPIEETDYEPCLLYTSPSPRDRTRSRMPSSA